MVSSQWIFESAEMAVTEFQQEAKARSSVAASGDLVPHTLVAEQLFSATAKSMSAAG
jgi:hypothetical protein